MDLVASFAGAAFAFGFFLVGLAIERAYERRKAHFNSLVTLERVLNLQLNDAFLIRRQVPDMEQPVVRGRVLVALPRPLPETDSLVLDLLDIRLTNALIDHAITVKRLNADILNIGEAYLALKDRYLDGSLEKDVYIENSQFLIGKYGEIVLALVRLDESIVEILVDVRLRLAERRPFMFWLIGRLSSVKAKPLIDAEREAERERFLAECAQVSNPLEARKSA